MYRKGSGDRDAAQHRRICLGDLQAPGEAARKRAALELIKCHEQTLRRTARRYSLCADDADDAYQRALVILLTKAPTEDPRS